uniref:Aldo_ket_red domain-containing protein n=1 Tax=Caenorhabditis japonica TaxID=281687 RepID=A0A8R1HPJ9_CAEJA
MARPACEPFYEVSQIEEYIIELFPKRTAAIWTFNIFPDSIHEEMCQALNKLHVDRVDLVLAHSPAVHMVLDETTFKQIWREFDALIVEGLTRSIEVCNWASEQISCAIALGLTPIHNRQSEIGEFFPGFEQWDLCAKHKITITIYVTFGSPNGVNFTLSVNPIIMKWVRYKLEDHFAVTLAAFEHHKYGAHVILRNAVGAGFILKPSSVHADKINEALNVFDFELTELEKEEISQSIHLEKRVDHRILDAMLLKFEN